MPSLNLPVKSIPSASTTGRELAREKLGKPILYHNLGSFKSGILNMKMKGWMKTENEDSVVF